MPPIRARRQEPQVRSSRQGYAAELKPCSTELVAIARWAATWRAHRDRDGRPRTSAGKGGAIKCHHRHLDTRPYRVWPCPGRSERRTGRWYFQTLRLPPAGPGEIVLFDRSWYNRAGSKGHGLRTRRAGGGLPGPGPGVRQLLPTRHPLFKYFCAATGHRRSVRRAAGHPLKPGNCHRIDVEEPCATTTTRASGRDAGGDAHDAPPLDAVDFNPRSPTSGADPPPTRPPSGRGRPRAQTDFAPLPGPPSTGALRGAAPIPPYGALAD